MRAGGEPDQFDPDGMVMFQVKRRLELNIGAEPATGVVMALPPGRGTRGWTNKHLNLTRSLADVDRDGK